MLKKLTLATFLLLLSFSFAQAQEEKNDEKTSPGWFDKIHLGGYMQVRYNGLFQTNPALECEQCDEAWGGEENSLSLRRLRFKIYGQIHPRVFFYFQPDFAKSVGESDHVGRLKDAYFDLGLDLKNEFRLRIGQSKVPFGYENMQSSSQRLPLDRDDALNSGLKDERDVGVFFYWANKQQRNMMTELKKDGMKHSGDFGVFALGVYNGQTANHKDRNGKFHVVTRFSLPIKVGNQVIEPGIQAYRGTYVLQETSPEINANESKEYLDERVAASFVLYPRPFGIQAEYVVGKGPEFNKETQKIEVQNLNGGYVTFSYIAGNFIPFTRLQYYDGGKKHEMDARSYTVKELELGLEWQPMKSFELVAMYTFSNRRYEDFQVQDNRQAGSLLRLQAQLNF
ncbi:Phosphate-selective porin O and P [Algoriphagus locisalis]|uniref:Phosphate-selective porin O and P n=1 Tax=Algoriphagus locisalis TaxID=305507 RepID=A0A1I7DBK9_9BACT|nr:porin [Algoriphagus locisalis]SFU09071.1 Phosphate-selective porin O and P [Algoriphagus locisalis]